MVPGRQCHVEATQGVGQRPSWAGRQVEAEVTGQRLCGKWVCTIGWSAMVEVEYCTHRGLVPEHTGGGRWGARSRGAQLRLRSSVAGSSPHAEAGPAGMAQSLCPALKGGPPCVLPVS